MMKSMLGRKSALWLATAISVLTFATVATSASAEEPCNGAVELCGRTLDQVVLPGTHNSMSNEEYGWKLPNQHYSIPTQLDKGIRAFLIDTHYGLANGNGVVANQSSAHRNDPGVKMYLCHEYCQLGSSELIPELAKVAGFLAANPREVLVFVVQDSLVPEDLATAVTESGLIDYVYTGSTSQYPTLAQMIESGQRVVMLSEGNTGDVPWYHNGYDGPMQETPYDFREAPSEAANQVIPRLTEADQLNESCRPNRGGEIGPLFLMNHFINGILAGGDAVTPDPAVAQIINQRDVLVNRARACETRRGKLPNIVAVDDFGDGDLITAVRELNGLTRPELSLKRPAKRVVKAGRKATFAVTLTNSGEEDAAVVKLCVAVPARLAIKPGCRRFALAQGQSKTIKLKVKARRKAKGSGKLTFKATGWGDVASTSTNFKVKPIKKKPKKPKRKKHRH